MSSRSTPPYPPLVVATDLDGTLLDHHDYSWDAAMPALELLRRWRVPLVLASSKTRIEMLAIREALGNRDPFVVENGAAIYVPRGYFDGPDTESERNDTSAEDASEHGAWDIEHLGPPMEATLEILHRIRRQHGFRFEGFADFGLDGIRRHTGLSESAARAAASRDGTEPILWLDERAPETLASELEPHGLQLLRGGRFLHVMGETDKGLALEALLRRYRRHQPDLRLIALGDSENDLGMLRAADRPVLIPRGVGPPLDAGSIPEILRAPHPGPAGWRWAIEHLLSELIPDFSEED